MAFVEFTGDLDKDSPGFVEFTGALDKPAPAPKPEQDLTRPAGALLRDIKREPAPERRESVLQGRVMPEPTFDPSEADRLSRKSYADAQNASRSRAPSMTQGSPIRPDVNADRGRFLDDAPMPVRAVAKAVTSGVQGIGGAVQAVGDAVGSSTVSRFGAGAAQEAQKFEQGMGDGGPVPGFGPQSPVPYFRDMTEAAATSLLQTAGLGGIVGSRAVIPALSVLTAGQEYTKARSAGLDPLAALSGAVPKGAFEALGEKFAGTDRVVGALGALMKSGGSAEVRREVSAELLRAGVREIPGEVATYLGQTGVDALPGIGLNPNLTMAQFLDGLRDTVVQSAIMGSGMGAGGALAAGNLPAARPPVPTAAQLVQERWGARAAAAPATPAPAGALARAAASVHLDAAAQVAALEGRMPDQSTAAPAAEPGSAVPAMDAVAALEAQQDAADPVAEVAPSVITPGAINELSQTQDTAVPQGGTVETTGGADLLDAAAPADLAPADLGGVAPGMPPSPAPAVAPGDLRAEDAGRADLTEPSAPTVHKTYEAADQYRIEQKRRGTSVQALPIQTEGGFALAMKGSPEYPAAEQLREDRRAAKERADAGILDGDILNKLGKPFTIRLPAANAVKANPGFEVVPVKGGFVARKAAPKAEAAPDATGKAIDQEWTAFAPESGTLSVPRAEMPQVQAEHRGAMVNFLKARGIDAQQEEVAADTLKPTQAEFSPEKVSAAKQSDGVRSVLVSSDGHVLDGHHQWMAKREDGEPVKVIRLGAPVAELLPLVKEFPSATTADAGAAAQRPAQTPIEQHRARVRVSRGVLPGDLLNRLDQPFKVKLPAALAAKKAGDGFEVVAVDGGFVARKAQADISPPNAVPASTLIAQDAIKTEAFESPKGALNAEKPAKQTDPTTGSAPLPGAEAGGAADAVQPPAGREPSQADAAKQRDAALAARPAFGRGQSARMSLNATLVANEPMPDYSRRYDTDLFGNPVPAAARKDRPARPTGSGVRGNAQPAASVQDTPIPAGKFFASTFVGAEAQRELGASKILTAEQAAQATRYLYQSAVERFDGIVTDARGKPLGVVGGFKGALAQASVYPSTMMAEAVRIPGAAGIWFSHNHPSGASRLSRADVKLNELLADVFRGSGIEPMGLLAIGNGEFSHVDAEGFGEYSPARPIPEAVDRTTVPAVERQLGQGQPGAQLVDPMAAKGVAKSFYDRAGEPGIMLLNTQSEVVAWIPITDVLMGDLRYTGGVAAIYRAISQSNAGAAILVHGGELDAKVPDAAVSVGQNIAAALQKVDVAPVDSINVRTGRSAAEMGLLIASGPVFSRDDAKEDVLPGMSIDAVQREVNSLLKNWANAPRVVVAASIDDAAVPAAVRQENARQQSLGATGSARGVFHEGTVYLLADQLHTDAHAAITLFHESLGHAGLQGTFGQRLNPILKQVADLRRADVVEKALEYGLLPAMKEGATLAEKYAALSRADRLIAAEEVLAEWAQRRPEIGYVKRAVAAIRAWFRKHIPGFQKLGMTDDEIIGNYLMPARGWIERGGARARSRPEPVRAVAPALSRDAAQESALSELSKADELFALPKSEKDSIAGIASDHNSDIKIRETRFPGNERMFTLTLPDDTTARVTVRQSSPNSVYGAELGEGNSYEWLQGRPGENPEDVDPAKEDVWIDVSSLKPGQNGAMVYNIAATYAHNTGRIFIGDPSGLSDAAMRRRSEQMLSSALKFGTTAHLAPHPRQVEGDAKIGVPALKWVYGDDEGNIERLIDLNVKALDNALPESKIIAYDPAKHSFYRTDTGAILQRGQLAFVVGQSVDKRPGMDGRQGRAGQAGWRTIARAALFRHLQAPHDAAGGRGRGSVLDGLREQRAGLRSEQAGGLPFAEKERIFYSRSKPAGTEDAGLTDQPTPAGKALRDKAEARYKQQLDAIQSRYEAEADPARRDAARTLAKRQYDAAVKTADAVPNEWSSPAPTRTDRWIYELQDGRVDLKRTQEAILAAGNKIDERFDARLAETLYTGRMAKRTQTFLEREVQPLMRVMTRLKIGQTELGDFMHAQAAPERNAQIAKVNPEMPDGGAGANSKGLLLTTAAATQYITDIEPLRRKQLEEAAGMVHAITKGTRSLLVTEGLEKAETIDAWEAAYKTYVPMFREDVEFNRITVHKRATGSDKKAVDILAHVLMQREAAITKAEKNRVAVSLYGLALSNPNLDFWATIRPTMQAKQVTEDLQRMGVDPLVAEAGMEGVPTIRTVDPVTNKVVDRINPMYRSLPGAITLKIKGEDRVLMLNVDDPRAARLAENLKNLDGLTKFDLAGSIVGKTTRWLAAVNTQWNPAFGVVNFVRDTLGGAIHLSNTALRGKSARVLGNVPIAMIGITGGETDGAPTKIAKAFGSTGETSEKWRKLYDQFQEDGGQTGFREAFRDGGERAKAIEKQLASLQRSGGLTPQRGAHAALDALETFNTVMENAVRLSAYKVALDGGMTRPEAARLARELTVDFNRKGRAGREAGPLYAFFNASLQGSERTLRAIRGPDGAKIIAGGLALGLIQSLALAAAGFDEDEIQEFTKARAFIIPLRDKRYIAIPLPLGLHVLPNTGRVIADLAIGDRKGAGGKMFDALGEVAGAFNPLGGGNVFTADGLLRTLAPTIIDPIIEMAANKNFAGNQIEQEARGERDPRPGASRAREGTLKTATGQAYLGISKALNTLTGGSDFEAGAVSPTPERVRYIAQTAGGGVLRELEKVINASALMTQGEGVKVGQLPLVSRFAGKVDSDQVEQRRYHKNVNRLEKLEGTLKAMQNAGDGENIDRMLAAHPEAAAISGANHIQAAVAKLNKLAVATVADRETLKQIEAARIEQMAMLNMGVRQLEESDEPTIAQKLKSSEFSKRWAGAVPK